MNPIENPIETMNTAQSQLWNGTAGRAWTDLQPLLDEMFAPFEQRLAHSVPQGYSGQVLDLGCGTGSTTRAVARRLGAGGLCTGVDISAPMIESARRNSGELPLRFVCADAQHHPFAPQSIDRIVSRFGVMFFDDPRQAFSRLRQAARPAASLHLYAWRGPQHNAFMTAAEQAAAPLIDDYPIRAADAPGQFAFADGDRVRRILDDAGWRQVTIRPVDAECRFAAAGLEDYLCRMGSLAQVLPRLQPALRERVLAAVRAAFVPFVDGQSVRFVAACWQIEARA